MSDLLSREACFALRTLGFPQDAARLKYVRTPAGWVAGGRVPVLWPEEPTIAEEFAACPEPLTALYWIEQERRWVFYVVPEYPAGKRWVAYYRPDAEAKKRNVRTVVAASPSALVLKIAAEEQT